MKKIISVFLLFLIVDSGIHAQQGYWFQKHFIELESNNSSQYYVQLIGEDTPKEERISIIKELVECNSVLPVSKDGYLIKATERPLNQKLYVSDLYHSSLSDHIIILPSLSFEMIDNCSASDILKKYSGILTLKAIEGNVYRLGCNLSTSKEILEIASQIYQDKNVKWCEPVKMSSWRTYNQKYSQQYYLKNTGQGNGLAGIDINVEPAWNLVSGSSNITVAVIDEGIDFDHEDMANCVLSGYTVENPTGYGAPQANNVYEKGHGVACAGIIAAEDNTIGIKGVASGVKLLPVNIVPNSGYYDYLGRLHQGFASDTEIAKAIVWASSRADILSCSWGGGAYSQDIVNAIDTARIFGRNGKGCVVVFTSGNNGQNYVNFPACTNGVVAVGAIDNTGSIWYYSQRGPELGLVAPSGDGNSTSDIVTTDRMGNLGYQTSGDWNYYDHFSGTSAACPQVAGVAALILSMRPDLTESVVRNILYSTARDLGVTGRDDTYGYGLVDAYAALKVVNSSISGKTVICDTANYVINGLPSSYTVNWSIDNSNFSISPSSNQCFVEYYGLPQYDVTNLTATISWQGTTIKTLSKRIVMHGALYVTGWQYGNLFTPNGTYPDREFTIPANNGLLLSRSKPERLSIDDIFAKDKESLPINFTEDVSLVSSGITPFDVCGYGITEINGGNTVYLNSTRFDGMDISFSGTHSPSYYYRSGNYVEFEMPYNGVEYYTKLHAQSDSGCHDFCLMFKVVPLPGAASGDDEIWVNLDGSMLYITFMGGSSGYSVTISKIPSGTQVYSNTFPGNQNSFSVNTSSWALGIYSIRIVQGNNVYTKSIYL